MNKPPPERLLFTYNEFSGSLGDMGLFIPLVVGMTIAGGLDIGMVLILAGLMNILTGWIFRQPIPVQPMKAIAVIVITEGLSRQELMAAGILMGVILLLLSGYVDQIVRLIPKAVVRGIQLGVGIKLMIEGVRWVGHLPLLGWDSIFVALCVIVILRFAVRRQLPLLVVIFMAGFFILFLNDPGAFSSFRFTRPHVTMIWPSPPTWISGFLKGALPQIPLTILNSVVALCALSEQYFPGRGINPRKVTASVGIMNLICVPFGGIPMCHGSGGLAAQYRFGARTGGSVIILGFLKIAAGIFIGGFLLGVFQNYPKSVLGPMLIFAGIELARSARDIIHNPKDRMISGVAAGCIVIFNTFVGFLAGSVIYILYVFISRRIK